MTMKKVIISWLFCLVTVFICGKDVCYYYFEEKICYKVSATRILIYSETLDITGIENALQHPVAGRLKNVYELGDGLFVVEMEHTSRDDLWEIQRQLSSREDVIYTSPVFGDMSSSAYSNEVLVRLKSADDYSVLQEYANVYHMIDIRTEEYLGACILTLPHNPEKNAAEIAIELYETGLFEHAEPGFIHLCPFEWCPFEPEEPEPDGNMNIVPDEQSVIFYPNPVSDMLYIDLEKVVRTPNKTVASYDIRLYSSLGNMVRQAKAPGGIVELNVSNLSDGICFLTIYAGNASKPETHKIIVKH
jgi:hypothetical protein